MRHVKSHQNQRPLTVRLPHWLVQPSGDLTYLTILKLLKGNTFFAALLPFPDSTSSCKRLNENKAIFNPEKIADCDMHNAMAIQVIISNDICPPSN